MRLIAMTPGAALALTFLSGPAAWAQHPSADPRPGRAAAHAALVAGAGLPDTPAQLPTRAADGVTGATPPRSAGKEDHAGLQTAAEARSRAADDIRDAHVEVAGRAAQASVAAASSAASAETRAAAGQARASAAKSAAGSHGNGRP